MDRRSSGRSARDSIRSSVPNKSFWRETPDRNSRFFCANCKAERKVSLQTRFETPMRYFQIACATAIVG